MHRGIDKLSTYDIPWILLRDRERERAVIRGTGSAKFQIAPYRGPSILYFSPRGGNNLQRNGCELRRARNHYGTRGIFASRIRRRVMLAG